MLKLFSISFSFLILSQSIGFNAKDILQLGEFIEHAQYHNEQYGDTFFEFVSKHYGELKAAHDEEHQEEREDHEKLPLQQTSQSISALTFMLYSAEISLNIIEFSEVRNINFHYKQSKSSLHSQKYLQPPRQS